MRELRTIGFALLVAIAFPLSLMYSSDSKQKKDAKKSSLIEINDAELLKDVPKIIRGNSSGFTVQDSTGKKDEILIYQDSVVITGDTINLVVTFFKGYQKHMDKDFAEWEKGVVVVNGSDTTHYHYGDTITIIHNSSEINYAVKLKN